MSEYFEFLMFELGDITLEREDDTEIAREIMITLSAVDGSIPETFYRLYTCNLDVNEEHLLNALAYFMGIGEIHVECDCNPEWKGICDIHNIERTDFFQYGKKSVGNDKEWYNIHNRVKELYVDLWE